MIPLELAGALAFAAVLVPVIVALTLRSHVRRLRAHFASRGESLRSARFRLFDSLSSPRGQSVHDVRYVDAAGNERAARCRSGELIGVIVEDAD